MERVAMEHGTWRHARKQIDQPLQDADNVEAAPVYIGQSMHHAF